MPRTRVARICGHCRHCQTHGTWDEGLQCRGKRSRRYAEPIYYDTRACRRFEPKPAPGRKKSDG